VFLKHYSVARGREEKGVGVDASAWRWEKEERGVGVAVGSAGQEGRQWPLTVGCGRRRCRANKGGRWLWAMRQRGQTWLTSGTGARRGPVAAAGVLGGKRERVMWQLWGADRRARTAQCRAVRFKSDLKQNPNSNVSNNFKLFQNLID
jgi:hypothetical protein